jgi:hypothetical protein
VSAGDEMYKDICFLLAKYRVDPLVVPQLGNELLAMMALAMQDSYYEGQNAERAADENDDVGMNWQRLSESKH